MLFFGSHVLSQLLSVRYEFFVVWYHFKLLDRGIVGCEGIPTPHPPQAVPLLPQEKAVKKPSPNMETETIIPSIHISTNMRPRLRQGPVAHYLQLYLLLQARLGSDIHTAHTPYQASTVPDSLCLFRAATVFVTVFRFFTYRFYYKDFKKSIVL